MPLRELDEVFGLQVTVTVALFEPLSILRVIQLIVSASVQFVLERILNTAVPPGDVKFSVEGFTLRLSGAPDWVTVTVRGATPVPVAVMVALLETVEVFGVQVTTTVPLLLPEAGARLIQLTVSETAQAVLD